MLRTKSEKPADGPVRLERITEQPENPFVRLIPQQEIAVIPSFTLECGVTLRNVPVAFTTRGQLSEDRDNVLVICHALTGSADVADWWGPLLGAHGRAFDVSRFFVICLNSLGSPYGSASPVTNKNGDPKLGRYGPEFPLTTIRDDVNIHRMVLDDLGVKQVAAVVGGSMGGMLVLEWAYFGKEYVRCIAPIATSSRHSAWCISWGEQQRQSIYCDPKYEDGYYAFDDPPASGLGAARMSALLTYRSRNSFQARFGRHTPDTSRRQNINGTSRPASPAGGQVSEHWRVHNEGHRHEVPVSPRTPTEADMTVTDPQFHGTTELQLEPQSMSGRRRPVTYFSAQSYLRYQGQKFVKRFDSNCYIAITRKLDTHDVSRGRTPDALTSMAIKEQADAIAGGLDTKPLLSAIPSVNGNTKGGDRNENDSVVEALGLIKQPALVIGIESDGLFTFAEQEELAACIPNGRLKSIDSPEGHDAFLLQFEQVNAHLLEFFAEVLPDIMGREGIVVTGTGENGDFTVKNDSVFGEAEVEDITAW